MFGTAVRAFDTLTDQVNYFMQTKRVSEYVCVTAELTHDMRLVFFVSMINTEDGTHSPFALIPQDQVHEIAKVTGREIDWSRSYISF